VFKFFEDVVSTLRHPNSPTPPELAARLDQALTSHSIAIPVLPEFNHWRDLVDAEQMSKFDRENNPSTRIFQCAYDLLFVAQTGLLVSYWSPLFARIAGSSAMRHM